MSGHNKWSQIKHKKGITDQKRGQLFSKMVKAISIAARDNPDPKTNIRLRSVIEKARSLNVPNENIERAVSKNSEKSNLTEAIYEAYGPEKTAMVIKTITDNKNRTFNDIKKTLGENNSKIADPGSVLWAFKSESNLLTPQYPQRISPENLPLLEKLIEDLEALDDVQEIITNAENISLKN